MVDVTVTNNNRSKSARVLEWIVPCDGNDATSKETTVPKDLSSFDVKTLGGQAAKYLGAVFKRAQPIGKDYLILSPGAEISCTINLGEYFEFVSPSKDDVYEIKFTETSLQLSAPYESSKSILETLNSDTLTVQIAARGFPTRSLRSRERKLPATNNFRNCDAGRQGVIADARSRAATEATNALRVIDDVGTWRNSAYCPRYNEWFGNYDYNRHNSELRPGYSAVRDRLNDVPIVFDCSCSLEKVYAYVYKSSPYDIYLCPIFWSAPMTGTNSKMVSYTLLLLSIVPT